MDDRKMNNDSLVAEMIRRIGDNPDRDGLKETPRRIVKMWEEIYRGYDSRNEPVVTVFKNGRDGVVYDEMVTDSGRFYSMCEHHMLPFIGSYHFGVVYHPEGNILGLSKIGRVVDYFSARLQIQERLVTQIVDFLWKALSVGEKEPLGMGLIMKGEHLCKTMRGVKKEGKMGTTKLKGTFTTDSAARAEFLSTVNRDW